MKGILGLFKKSCCHPKILKVISIYNVQLSKLTFLERECNLNKWIVTVQNKQKQHISVFEIFWICIYIYFEVEIVLQETEIYWWYDMMDIILSYK